MLNPSTVSKTILGIQNCFLNSRTGYAVLSTGNSTGQNAHMNLKRQDFPNKSGTWANKRYCKSIAKLFDSDDEKGSWQIPPDA